MNEQPGTKKSNWDVPLTRIEAYLLIIAAENSIDKYHPELRHLLPLLKVFSGAVRVLASSPYVFYHDWLDGQFPMPKSTRDEEATHD